jgi:hypothetical protein
MDSGVMKSITNVFFGLRNVWCKVAGSDSAIEQTKHTDRTSTHLSYNKKTFVVNEGSPSSLSHSLSLSDQVNTLQLRCLVSNQTL